MQLSIDTNTPGKDVFYIVGQHLQRLALRIKATDDKRPWGGFFVIDENDTPKFIKLFFPELNNNETINTGKLSPKILIIAPGKRLSWQYHHRRSELWKLISGEAKMAISDNDEETAASTILPGDFIEIKQGRRHRLIGADKQWGIVAEIWQHTNANDPSNEDDIIRLQDDFGR